MKHALYAFVVTALSLSLVGCADLTAPNPITIVKEQPQPKEPTPAADVPVAGKVAPAPEAKPQGG